MTSRTPLVLVSGLFKELPNGDTIDSSRISGLPAAGSPAALVGLSAVNGSASTFMRSDAAPALDPSIAPTWTAKHVWSYSATLSLGGNTVYSFSPSVTAPGGGTTNCFAQTIGISLQGTDAFNLVRAQNVVCNNAGNANVATFQGALFYVQNSGSGTITSAIPFSCSVAAVGGAITTAQNMLAGSPFTSGGGTIATSYGVRVSAQKVTGVTTGVAVGCDGASDYSYFAGNVSVGKTSAPSTTLDVNGPICFKSYTTSTLPSASVAAGQEVYVSDDGGGSTPTFSDGTNWRRVSDRAIVSTSNPVAQASGSYTPTLTNSVNVTSSTAHTCYWTQIGKIVTVTGTVELTSTTNATDTKLGISLPIAATLSNYDHLSGVANSVNAATKNAAGIVTGDASSNKAILEFNAIAGADLNIFRFTFTYTL